MTTDDDQVADDTFSYDDAGRQTQRVVDGKTTDLTWDVSSNLVKAVVSPGTASETVWAYLYDASGQRVAKIQATDTNQDDTLENKSATVYFGDTEVTDANTTSTGASDLSADRFFTFAGATVAVVHAEQVASTTLDTQLLYMFGDFQGSAQVMMSDARDVNGDPDPANAVITRNAYTPYGAKRSINTDTSNDDPTVTMDASLDLERGWLSQIADEDPTAGGTGLTYLNARYYDPVASRFISPDPLMNPSDPKTLDPYRYAENNPVFYSDATGLSAESVCGLYGCPKASNSVCGLYGCFGGKPGDSGGAWSYAKHHKSGSGGTGSPGGPSGSAGPSHLDPSEPPSDIWLDNFLPRDEFPVIEDGPTNSYVQPDSDRPWTLTYADLVSGYQSLREDFIFSKLNESGLAATAYDADGNVAGVYLIEVNHESFDWDTMSHQLDFMDYQFHSGMLGFVTNDVDLMENEYLKIWGQHQGESQRLFGKWETGLFLHAANRNVEFYLDRVASLPRSTLTATARDSAREFLRAAWRK